MTVADAPILPEWCPDHWADAGRILKAAGKLYPWQPVPKGLPRYRAISCCHYNAWRACADDRRLRYVEGVARTDYGMLVHHAWVTLDGMHAIDLTWRGTPSRWRGGTMTIGPAAAYYGVEIPLEDVTRLYTANRTHCGGGSYLCLADWYAEHERAKAA